MQTLLTPGSLHDADGGLAEAGWARRELRRYDRAAVQASRWRIKEWDYYCIANDTAALALTVADNAYLGFLGLSWIDLTGRTATNHGATRAMPLGRMALPASADSGDIVQQFGGVSLAFRHVPGGRVLTFDAPNFGGGKGLKGELSLTQPDEDRMVIATPFAEDPLAFYYNQKINCLRASGVCRFDGREYVFDPAEATAVLDWGRGVWTYRNTWYWGSGSGWSAGHLVGWNLGYGFGDTSCASENMLFVDGVAHKLDRVTFHIPQHDGMDDFLSPWRIDDNEGRVSLTFTPVLDRKSCTDVGIIGSDQHQVFGFFDGFFVMDGGVKMPIRHFLAFAEKVKNKW